MCGHFVVISFSEFQELFIQEKKRKYEAPIPTRIGKRKKGGKGPDAATKLPTGTAAALILLISL